MIIHGQSTINIKRNDHGIPHIKAESFADSLFGLGYCHAMDRGLQLLLTRILGLGKASQYLTSNDELQKMDLFFRKMHWKGDRADSIHQIKPEYLELLQSYCDGVNHGLSKHMPWELKLFRYKPEKWTVEDSMLVSRMMGYVSLCQSQADVERLLVEMVQAGVAREKLDSLFPGILTGLDESLLRKVTLSERVVPKSLLWERVVPRMVASNNWAISGERTESGFPIFANDPHLEGNRLPNVWYEAMISADGRFGAGASIPGLAGIPIGRTTDLAWGATYSFMDTVDSWIEECRDGKYLKEGDWHPFEKREELIERKGKSPLTKVFYENEHGVLDGDPRKDGFYLTTRWSCAEVGAKSLARLANIWSAKSVEEGMDCLGRVETPWNWALADRNGNIGYQMSGLKPKRREGISGFAPLPGWDSENDWKGFEDPADLPREVNPNEGFIVTSNQNLNHLGKSDPINMPMGDYRARRLEYLVKTSKKIDLKRVKAMHHDLYSLQAEDFMKIIRPLLPESKKGKILKAWGGHYTLDSKGAVLFEEIYHALYKIVFGEQGVGHSVVDFLKSETGIFTDFYHCFDRVLLSEESPWFGEKSRDDIYREAIQIALSRTDAKEWKDVQRVTLTHILFNGKLPRSFGFDRGPIPFPGGRATPHQGQIYRVSGRTTSFAPSYRCIADFSTDELHTNMIGGVSDRRFSKWYCSDLKNWCEGKYKVLRPSSC